jgi:hypothetical protein
VYDVTLFNKKAGTNCPYEAIEWIENGEERRLKFVFVYRNHNIKNYNN